MNTNNRKLIALIQDALILCTRFPVVSRLTYAQPASIAPTQLRLVRIAS
jgi:hypothetical protein